MSYRLTLDVSKIVDDLRDSSSVEIPGLLFERVVGSDDLLETVVYDDGKILAITQLLLRSAGDK